MPDSKSYDLDHTATEKKMKTNISMVTYMFVFFHIGFKFFWKKHYNYNLDPLHVLSQVSFGCWVTWSISSWQEYQKGVFFPQAIWWVAELLCLSLNDWGPNFLQNQCSQSFQIYHSWGKTEIFFFFQSCKQNWLWFVLTQYFFNFNVIELLLA